MCSPGAYNTPDDKTCRRCPAGKFSNLVTSLVRPGAGCLFCPMGRFSNSKNTKCGNSCAPGTFQSGKHCMECPPGKYMMSPLQRLSHPGSSCAMCPRGKYQGASGKRFCFDCPDSIRDEMYGVGLTKCTIMQTDVDEVVRGAKKATQPVATTAPVPKPLPQKHHHFASTQGVAHAGMRTAGTSGAMHDVPAPSHSSHSRPVGSPTKQNWLAAWTKKNAPIVAALGMFVVGSLLSIVNNFGVQPKQYEPIQGAELSALRPES